MKNTKGGKREGAGAKPRSSEPSKNRSIKFTDSEWDHIKQEALRKGLSASEYIREIILEKYTVKKCAFFYNGHGFIAINNNDNEIKIYSISDVYTHVSTIDVTEYVPFDSLGISHDESSMVLLSNNKITKVIIFAEVLNNI